MRFPSVEEALENAEGCEPNSVTQGHWLEIAAILEARDAAAKARDHA